MDRETMDFFQTLFDSLKREMHQEFGRVNEQLEQVKARLDRMEARQDRQGGLLQGGSRAMTRVIEWTERADGLWAERDRRLDALEERPRKLENGRTQ
ncbi:MAG: hypothetical protein ABSH32_35810 [Bryobacteraceae bacterium]|jgi:hypothetical protein